METVIKPLNVSGQIAKFNSSSSRNLAWNLYSFQIMNVKGGSPRWSYQLYRFPFKFRNGLTRQCFDMSN